MIVEEKVVQGPIVEAALKIKILLLMVHSLLQC